jgi:hypothetical protein
MSRLILDGKELHLEITHISAKFPYFELQAYMHEEWDKLLEYCAARTLFEDIHIIHPDGDTVMLNNCLITGVTVTGTPAAVSITLEIAP